LNKFIVFQKSNQKRTDFNNMTDEQLDKDLSKYLYSLLESKYTRLTCKTMYTSLCGALNRNIGSRQSKFVLSKGVIDGVMKEKHKTERPRPKRDPFQPKQLEAILKSEHCNLNTALGINTAALFVYGIGFALRIEELLRIKFKYLSIITLEKEDGETQRFLKYDPLVPLIKHIKED